MKVAVLALLLLAVGSYGRILQQDPGFPSPWGGQAEGPLFTDAVKVNKEVLDQENIVENRFDCEPGSYACPGTIVVGSDNEQLNDAKVKQEAVAKASWWGGNALASNTAIINQKNKITNIVDAEGNPVLGPVDVGNRNTQINQVDLEQNAVADAGRLGVGVAYNEAVINQENIIDNKVDLNGALGGDVDVGNYNKQINDVKLKQRASASGAKASATSKAAIKQDNSILNKLNLNLKAAP